jgi:hypothetical protein
LRIATGPGLNGSSAVKCTSTGRAEAAGTASAFAPLNRRDIQPDFSAELALAGDAAALVDRVTSRLTYGAAGPALKAEIVGAVNAITLPATNAEAARRNRVNAAVLLTLAAPEFVVVK